VKWSDTAAIDELIARYHQNYLTYYAFFDDASDDFGDHEEAVLRAQIVVREESRFQAGRE
jgi:hypothetical protein